MQTTALLTVMSIFFVVFSVQCSTAVFRKYHLAETFLLSDTIISQE